MNKREAKRIVLRYAAASLRTEVANGSVWIGDSDDDEDIAKIEDAIEEVAEELDRRAERLTEKRPK